MGDEKFLGKFTSQANTKVQMKLIQLVISLYLITISFPMSRNKTIKEIIDKSCTPEH